MLFDTHTHPQMPQYDNDRDEVIKRALDKGIFMLCVGIDLKTSKQAIELAQKYKGVWASVGLHPNDVSHQAWNLKLETWINDYGKLLKEPKVVAVGEVGLDYYRTTDPKAQEKQREVLKQFINLTIQYNKPLILHCRDSHTDMIKIIENLKLKIENSLNGVIHSFTGTIEEAKKYLDLGFFIGFNGIITFPPSRKATEGTVPMNELHETVIHTPLDRILLETDAPFLTPEPHRGKRNESSYIEKICQKIADLKNLSFEEVAEKTNLNAHQIFDIKI
ncbi:MAG: TatD family hydrolase [Parcubacteria group bacterium]|nr:TatD family hydrolase [Parcubacteria group bacterium]